MRTCVLQKALRCNTESSIHQINNSIIFNKTESFTLQDTVKRMRRQAIESEKTFAKYTSDKGLVKSKELINPTSKFRQKIRTDT